MLNLFKSDPEFESLLASCKVLILNQKNVIWEVVNIETQDCIFIFFFKSKPRYFLVKFLTFCPYD